jgi:hypothetical protein
VVAQLALDVARLLLLLLPALRRQRRLLRQHDERLDGIVRSWGGGRQAGASEANEHEQERSGGS